jgi:PhzF family phenazine biosynthesis protein
MKLFQVDAFADQPFQGNPACVFLMDGSRPDTWMQSLASEMNLSETAFLLKQSQGYSLRWFTPRKEVSLCGHATLAAAHILWEEGILQPDEEIVFNTLSGPLQVRRDRDWILMDFPARYVVAADENPQINQALGIRPTRTSRFSSAKGDLYLLEFEGEKIVREIEPDFERLLVSGARIVIVTSRSQSPEYDFVSRYFAPAIGINEDPVTGSAHCYLAPYWGARLKNRTLVGFQVSERKGTVGCTWVGDRVLLRGKAVTILRGDLLA